VVTFQECVKKPHENVGLSFYYLRSPDPGPVGVNVEPLGERLGISVFPEAFLALLGAVDPVVPDTLPMVFIDEPLVPLIPVVEPPPLLVCASANVLESAKAVASAIVVSFMAVLRRGLDEGQPRRPSYRSLNSSLSAMEAPSCSHLAEPQRSPQFGQLP
jgi:hypothetical protein